MVELGPNRQAAHCARAALTHWGLSDAELAFASARENIVYRVDTRDGASFALRLHRPGYHSLPELRSENQWTTALNEAGIATPRPVPTLSGDAYALIPFGDSGGDTRVVGLIEWIAGMPMSDVLLAGTDSLPQLMRDVGTLIARLHEHALRWTPPAGFVRPALDVDGLLGDEPFWHPFWTLPELDDAQSTLILRARDQMRQELRDFDQRADAYSLIHADMLPQNIIVRDGQPVVIDFDDSAFGWHLYDLANALLPYQSYASFGSIVRAAVEGYRRVRPLAETDLQMLPMFMVIRQLAVLGWLDRKVATELHVSAEQKIGRAELLAPRIKSALAGCQAVLEHVNPFPQMGPLS